MKALALGKNRLIKTKKIFTIPRKLYELRTTLKEATQEKFKEIDRARAAAIDEAHKRYLD